MPALRVCTTCMCRRLRSRVCPYSSGMQGCLTISQSLAQEKWRLAAARDSGALGLCLAQPVDKRAQGACTACIAYATACSVRANQE